MSIIGHKYRDLTPLVWAYLWNIGNHIVKEDTEKIELSDIDIFLYCLENGVDIDKTIVETAIESAGYCEKNNFSIDDAITIISKVKENAFSPLLMFPQKEQLGGSIPIFDADWLTSLVARVHDVTGYTPDYIMNNMTMTACCFYFVQYARKQGGKDIERRPEAEILEAIDYRWCELIVEQLIKNGVIKEKDKQKFIDLISTNPNK